MVHVPVLLAQTVAQLVTAPGGWYVDGTAGAGGHSVALLAAAGLDAHLLAVDRDATAVALARAALAPFGDRARVVQANFADLATVAADLHIQNVQGILLDLGVSAMQLDQPTRGFSFQLSGPLDMRMDVRQNLTAAQLLQQLTEAELIDILRRYGEEPMARRVAKSIQAAVARGEAPTTTEQLAGLVAKATGGRRGRTHPATKTFQALRIAVNSELAALSAVLPAALNLLAPGGRLAVISFHSLEDRLVKQFMRTHEGRHEALAQGGSRWAGRLPRGRRVVRKAIVPTTDEIVRNPRARSAKLRVLERMA